MRDVFLPVVSIFKVVLGLQGPLVNGVVLYMGDVSLLEVFAYGGSRCIKDINVLVVSVYRRYLLFSFVLQTILLHRLLKSTQMNRACPT